MLQGTYESLLKTFAYSPKNISLFLPARVRIQHPPRTCHHRETANSSGQLPTQLQRTPRKYLRCSVRNFFSHSSQSQRARIQHPARACRHRLHFDYIHRLNRLDRHRLKFTANLSIRSQRIPCKYPRCSFQNLFSHSSQSQVSELESNIQQEPVAIAHTSIIFIDRRRINSSSPTLDLVTTYSLQISSLLLPKSLFPLLPVSGLRARIQHPARTCHYRLFYIPDNAPSLSTFTLFPHSAPPLSIAPSLQHKNSAILDGPAKPSWCRRPWQIAPATLQLYLDRVDFAVSSFLPQYSHFDLASSSLPQYPHFCYFEFEHSNSLPH
jgi:hypothetical protein